jgi:hypothetical protein
MHKLSASTIQTFVAGALALMGFQALVWLPYYLVAAKDLVFVIGSIFSGLSLWIGIAILFGSKAGVWWAHVYLWLCSLGSVGMGCIYVLAALNVWQYLPHATWRGLSELPMPVILLCLLIWSRSKRFGDSRTPNTALEPTPTAP